jgi:hypothetical protein
VRRISRILTRGSPGREEKCEATAALKKIGALLSQQAWSDSTYINGTILEAPAQKGGTPTAAGVQEIKQWTPPLIGRTP